jgi:hypothetical protein
MGQPYRTIGMDQFSLGGQVHLSFGPGQPKPLWIEATWIDADGTLFAWHHHEPGAVCADGNLTSPKNRRNVLFTITA